MHSLEQTHVQLACALIQYIHSHASIYATVSAPVCTVLSADVLHTHKTHWHTVHFARRQCLCSPAHKWSKAVGLSSVTYFFSPLSFFRLHP